MRAAIYARVSTFDQNPENQLEELRRYASARGWTAKEFIDHGVSGAKDRRPALDELLTDARRRRFDVLVVWSLDRAGRSLKHLLGLLDDLHAIGVSFVSLREGLDSTTPSGRLQFSILGAIAEFERARLRERTMAGLRRARARGIRLGRRPVRVTSADLASVAHLSVRAAARFLRIAPGTLRKARRACQETSAADGWKTA
jgi:DNA invertase Pin-like site-specific DNA recombinase